MTKEFCLPLKFTSLHTILKRFLHFNIVLYCIVTTVTARLNLFSMKACSSTIQMVWEYLKALTEALTLSLLPRSLACFQGAFLFLSFQEFLFCLRSSPLSLAMFVPWSQEGTNRKILFLTVRCYHKSRKTQGCWLHAG